MHGSLPITFRVKCTKDDLKVMYEHLPVIKTIPTCRLWVNRVAFKQRCRPIRSVEFRVLADDADEIVEEYR